METPFTIKSSSSSRTVSTSLRDEREHDRQRILEKNNLDLKMKIHNLEEGLKRVQYENSAGQVTSGSNVHWGSAVHGESPSYAINSFVNDGVAQSEIFSLRLKMEEKQLELEQRNSLLAKAKNAIEVLKAELQRVKDQRNYDSDLEDRYRKLQESSNEMELDYRERLMGLENELFNAKVLINSKDKELADTEQKLRQRESDFKANSERISTLQSDNQRLQEQASKAQQSVSFLSDELTQSKAHMDLYKMQLEEEGTERDALKHKLKEATNEFDYTLKSLRHSHAEEIEKLRSSSSQSIASIQEQYRTELTQSRTQLMTSLQEMQSNGFADANRVREDANRAREEAASRISEKDDELRRFHNALDSERAKNESLSQELKSSKRDGNFALEAVQAEVAKNITEVKILEQALTVEKRQHELTKEKMELTNSLLRSAEEKLADSAAVKQLLEQMRHESEGMKETVFRLQSDLNTVTYQKTLAEKETGKGVAEITTLTSRIRLLEAEVAEKDSIDHALVESQRRLQEANDRLAELRASTAALKFEMDSAVKGRAEVERKNDVLEGQVATIGRNLGQACAKSIFAMHSWDTLLTSILDGESFLGAEDGVSRRELSFMDTDLDLRAAEAPAQQLQEIAVAIERVKSKLTRLQKIRIQFSTQARMLTDRLQYSLTSSEERVSLLDTKVKVACAEIERVRATVDRDGKLREQEIRELRLFRDSLCSEQVKKISKSDLQVQQLRHELQSELESGEELRRRLEAMKADFSTKQSQHQHLVTTVSTLTAELEEMRSKELQVSSLSGQVTVLTTAHEQLRDLTHEQERQIVALSMDKTHLTASVTELQAKLSDKERALSDLTQEIERLRSTQIDPQLQRAMQETQFMLKQYSLGSTSVGLSPQDLCSAYRELVDRSGDMLLHYERDLSPMRSTSSRDILSLSQSVHMLLEKNQALGRFMQQFVSTLGFESGKEEQKGDFFHGNYAVQNGPGTPPHSERRNSSYNLASHSLHPTQSISNIYFPPPSSGFKANDQYDFSSRQSTFQSRFQPSTQGSHYHNSYRSFNYPQMQQIQRSSVSFVAEKDPMLSTPLSSGRDPTLVSGTTSYHRSHLLPYQSLEDLQRDRIAYTNIPKPNGNSIFNDTPSSAVPMTAPETGSRMIKMGSDLEELSRKLDALDNSRFTLR